MAYNYEYPYTNVKENADWILHELKHIIAECDLTKKTVEDLKKEIEEHFSHFGEEIMKQLQLLIEDGTMQRLIQQAMLANMPTTKTSCSWFAQIKSTIYESPASQGFTTWHEGSDDMCAVVFLNDGTHASIAIWNMTTGEFVDEKEFTDLGHGNSLAYSEYDHNFYVACAGGSEAQKNVVRVSRDLATSVVTDVERPYGVSVVGDKLYCLIGSGIVAKYQITAEGLVLINTVRLDMRKGTTGQGFFTDGKYIFIPNGNGYTTAPEKMPINYVDVYSMTGDFVTSSLMETGLEVEEVSIVSGVAYASCNTNRQCVILKIRLYSTLENLQSDQISFMKYSVNAIVQELHINEEYTGFFMDGSYAHRSALHTG